MFGGCTKAVRGGGNQQPKIAETTVLQLGECLDGNVCEAYVIPFLFGLFFVVCHPYIIVYFVEMFFVT